MTDVEIAEYAIRYCINRSSYAFADGLALADQHWHNLAESTQRDVLDALDALGEDADAFLDRLPTLRAVRNGQARCERCRGSGQVGRWVGTWTGRQSHPYLGRKISGWTTCPQCDGEGAK